LKKSEEKVRFLKNLFYFSRFCQEIPQKGFKAKKLPY